MCGIAGIWGSSEPADAIRRSLERMLDRQAHRGPDGRDVTEYAGGGVGMVRLALVDLSEKGQQPMWTADGRVAIVFNGEMYNFREKRHELERAGHSFRSGTDTEVVLALYLEHGLAFVDHVRGMFALAIVDARPGGPDPELVLARDAFGMKPLFVSGGFGGRPLIFASELRALVGSGIVDACIDHHAVADYLSFGCVLQPRTMFAGVRSFEPGTLERHARGRPTLQRRFNVPAATGAATPARTDLRDAAKDLRAVLEESVRLHAFADAKVGAFLSGGIDSTAIVGLMRPHVHELRTYCLRFVDDPSLDEGIPAEETARRLGCEFIPVEVSDRDVAAMAEAALPSLDQPSTDGLNTWLISQAAARDVKGVLSGLGGDEMFSGYPVAGRMAARERNRWHGVESLAAHGASQLGRLAPVGTTRHRLEGLGSRTSPTDMWAHSRRVFSKYEVRHLVGAVQPAGLPGVLDDLDPGWTSRSAVQLSRLLDTSVYMRNQLLRDSDSTSMAHSLELRLPLVDAKVGAFVQSCGDELMIAPANGAPPTAKRVFIEAIRDLLPPDAESRPKQGFVLPHVRWLAGPLREMAEDACSFRTVQARGLVDPAVAERVWTRAKEGDHWSSYPQAWSLVVLEQWCRAWL